MDRPDDPTLAARQDASAALRRLRDAAGGILTELAESQPVAPHHLIALQAVADGSTTPTDVATATGRHLSSVSRLLDQLVELGLVDRGRDPDDRRQVLVALTDRGEQVVRTFESLDHAISARMMADFDADEARQLARFLDRLAVNATALADELEADPSRLEEYR